MGHGVYLYVDIYILTLMYVYALPKPVNQQRHFNICEAAVHVTLFRRARGAVDDRNPAGHDIHTKSLRIMVA